MPHKVAATEMLATAQHNDDAGELRRVIVKKGIVKVKWLVRALLLFLYAFQNLNF